MADLENPIIRQVCVALKRHQNILMAVVFGSVAEGTAQNTSDVDVAVLANDKLTAEQTIALIEDIAHATGRAVDLIDLRKAGQPVLSEIVAHGKQILGARSHWGDLIFRNVMDQEDFVPYQQRILEGRRQAWINSQGPGFSESDS
jgi:predicted nucleotidyltransferase